MFFLKAMEDRLIGRLGLAVGLTVSHDSEPCFTAQVAEIDYELTGVELLLLSKMMARGMPKRVMMFCQMNLRTLAVAT